MNKAARALPWLLLLPVTGPAQAASSMPAAWLGHWTDASAGTAAAIGDLTVAPDRLAIAGLKTWRISPQAAFGSGQLFRIAGPAAAPDPLGCGPGSTVSFIAITPIPADPGMTGPGIKLLFFSDAAPPDPAKAGRDPRLCETHPFTR